MNATIRPEAAEVIASVEALADLAEAIRDLREVPAGHLYARLAGVTTLAGFDKAIRSLVSLGVVTRDRSHLITWIGTEAHIVGLRQVADKLTAKYTD